MSPTADAAPNQPETATGAPPERTDAATGAPPDLPAASPGQGRSATRRPLGEQIGAHPVLAGAAAVVLAAGGAFGAGFAVGDATHDDALVGPGAQNRADLAGPPRLNEELPGLHERDDLRDRERDTRRDRERDDLRDRDGDNLRDRERMDRRDRFGGDRGVERDDSGSTDSGDS